MHTHEHIANHIVGSLRALEIPVVSIGLFGSSRHNPGSLDIDVLVLCRAPTGDDKYTYDAELTRIAELMAGSRAPTPVRDSRIPQVSDSVQACLRDALHVPVEIAFGPLPYREALTVLTVHLNGPATQRMWHCFAQRFPLHAISIVGNYTARVPYRCSLLRYSCCR